MNCILKGIECGYYTQDKDGCHCYHGDHCPKEKRIFKCVECGDNFEMHESRIKFMRPPIVCGGICLEQALKKQGRQVS